MSCFFCGISGHIARDCRKAADSRFNSALRGSTGNRINPSSGNSITHNNGNRFQNNNFSNSYSRNSNQTGSRFFGPNAHRENFSPPTYNCNLGNIQNLLLFFGHNASSSNGFLRSITLHLGWIEDKMVEVSNQNIEKLQLHHCNILHQKLRDGFLLSQKSHLLAAAMFQYQPCSALEMHGKTGIL